MALCLPRCTTSSVECKLRSLELRDEIERARKAIGLVEGISTRAYRVERLDHPGQSYLLLVFGENQATKALAILNGVNGDLESWSRTSSTAEPIVLDRSEALHSAGAPPNSIAKLVWRPSRASRSPFYPFWAIRAEGGRIRYVDQQRHVWDDL
jgi:hypothetical protein